MASAAIKGLTVEIGGDTTKLGEALDSVEKKSRSLSGELKGINSLLKMDPGNTELLAQKQEVLTEAITNTAAKLETLKEAEKQVQAQFERGEVSADQVRDLKREIIATENKLSSYSKALQETVEGVEQLGDGAGETGDELGETGDEAKKSAKKVDDLGSASEKAEKKSGKLGSTLASAVKAGLTAVGAAATAAIAGLTAAAESTREYRTEMAKLDTAFTQNGFSADTARGAYQALQGILGETDQSVEAVNHLAQLTDNEKDLATWTGDILPGVFATFGDSLPIEGLTEAANETAKVGQVTGPLADALNWAGVSEDAFNESLAKCSTEQERQALITETLAGLYGDAAAAYKETNAEVIRANQANDAWMQSMSGVGAAVEPIITDVKMMGASLLSELVPGVQDLAGAFRDLLNGDSGGAEAVGTALSGLITQLLDKIVQLAPTIVTAATSLLTTLTTTLVSMLPAVTTTLLSMLPQLVTVGVQLITSLLDGLTTAIPQITQAIVDLIPQLVQALVTGIPQLIVGAVQFLMAIVQAIPQIIPPLLEALPQIVLALVDGLISALPQLLTGAVQFLMAIVQAIPQLISALVPQIPTIVLAIIDGLVSNIPILLEGAVQLLHAIVEAIPMIIEALVPQIPAIVTTITDKLIEMAPTLWAASGQLFWELIKAIPPIVTALIQNLPQILEAIMSVLNMLPELLSGLFNKAMAKVGEWVGSMTSKALEVGSQFLANVTSFFSQLPGKIQTWLTTAVNKVVTWGADMAAKAKSGMKSVISTVTTTLSELPTKIRKVGKNLVEGLWNGINDKLTWLKNKIKSFTTSVLDSIKEFFGVHSPSRETAWIGDMLDQGLAEGMLDNVDTPIRAMHTVAGGVLDAADGLNGITLERRLHNTFAAPTTATTAEGGMLDKLDKILAAIEAGQVLTIDGKRLVGATAARYDNALGQRHALAVRGAL